MKKKLVSGLLMGTLMATMALTGCGSKGQSTISTGNTADATNSVEAVSTSTYHKLYDSEFSTLNYLKTSTIWEMYVGANTVDTLVEYDSDGQLKEGLATSWEYDEASTTWTFHLRNDAKWVDHTGKEVATVTAQDFVDALKYQLTPEYECANAQNFFGIIKNAEAYYKGQVYNGDADEEGVTWSAIDFSEVGVKAVDDTTLQYTLEGDVPYFLSSLVYVIYMPAYGPQLQELGKDFGTDYDKMYYCGAYYLSDYEPQVKHIYTKNPLNYDAEHVYIETIEETYNAEANTLAPEMVKRNQIDYADIGADILDDWLANEETKNLVSKERPDTSYEYFYCFNFDPQFDVEYEPDNWKKAVNNENFRQSMMSALNRVNAIAISEPNTPADYIENTITPKDFAYNEDGTDYTKTGELAKLVDRDSFDEKAAVSYKEAAILELSAEGVTFPIKVLMPYNPTSTNWDKECQVVEQQMEGVLGTDYIDIIVEAGPADSFLTEVRRSGKYAFMKCGWGADYADPETWTDPFYQEPGDLGYKYAFMRTSIDEGLAASDTVAEYFSLVEAAKEITTDTKARYEAFAKAESYLIEHALVIPYGIEVSAYIATKQNLFEGQYAPFGVSKMRYKGLKMSDHFISLDEYNQNAK